jgi:ATP-dependent Lhr-like helicase
MSFHRLDPLIIEALKERGIHEPTPPQRDSIPMIMDGRNVLVIAPTGMGKTESAMLPIMHMIMREPGKGIKCIYITPLRALNRDMLRRMEDYGNALGIRIAVRHGDTSAAERSRQSQKPPDILITTPETLQIMFTGKNLREHISRVQWVVVDEIHELATGERGAQLAVALERLVLLAGEFQRIGLSATVGEPEEVAAYLGGVGRDVVISRHDMIRELELWVESPLPQDEDLRLAGKMATDPDLIASMRRAMELVQGHASTLFFVNTRETAEGIAARYHMWDGDFPIGVHHGSLSKDIRVEMEDRFKHGDLKALVCTSSLELGIDVGSTELVIQYNSPRQVSRLVQRAGRAGHRIGEKVKGAIIATDPDEVAEAMVVVRRALSREIEKKRARPCPLTVLANQLVAMTMSERVAREDAWRMLRRSQPFRGLGREAMDEVLDQLLSIKMLFEDEEGFRRTRKGMKYFYDNISMIPDERSFLIRDISNRAIVGTLDESFVASFAEPFATFIAKGRNWRIIEIREDELLVEQVGEIGSVPSWVGEDIPVPFEVAAEVGRMRRRGDLRPYNGDENAKQRVKDYIETQRKAGPVPSDKLMTLEVGDRLAIINSCFGSRVNETLSKILSALLTARLGESVGVSTDAYRIVLELPRNPGKEVLRDTLLSIKPESVESLARLVVRNSSYLRWRFVYVAKKFGIVDKDADHRYMKFSRLFELYEGTPVYREAVDKVIFEDLDLEGTRKVMQRLQDGSVRLEVTAVSPMGQQGIGHAKELIQPQRADHAILMALKKRLEDEVLFMSCLNCRSQVRRRSGDAPEREVCEVCGGEMVAALKGYERETLRLLGKIELSEADRRDLARLWRNANIVHSYGRKAVLALSGRGVGPDAASRILQMYHQEEDDLLRDILAAEVNYARTKRFWD